MYKFALYSSPFHSETAELSWEGLFVIQTFDSFNKILCSHPNKTSFPGPFYGTIILFLTEDWVWKEM